MSESFMFRKSANMAVPDLSGINGFGHDANGSPVDEPRIGSVSDTDIFPEDLRGGAVRSARLAHNQEAEGSNPSPATNYMGHQDSEWHGEIFPPEPSYFAPQASILRVGEDVAIKVLVQTPIRDESILEELRTKAQDAITQLELHYQETEKVKQASDTDRDPTPQVTEHLFGSG